MASQLPQPIQFGKYLLFERIGRGGMADVFKGRIQGPAGFERVFVVKRILPHLSDDPAFNRMFVEEAKMSARLNHPNIVQVFELGSVDGEYFISMEHVRGRDLAETMRVLWARLGPPRPELVAYVGREICRALSYAHTLADESGKPLGMIHRDVSPSNVMLSYEGAVKLLDFGIAKALGDTTNKEETTHTGTLKGKFAYMAPEQTETGNVDRRIDLFATGIVLHEVLTGRRLFKGQNDLQTIERVRQCRVDPPSAQNPLCPPELDAVVLKALARSPDGRYQSAAEMAEALDDVVHAARFQPEHLAQLMRELFPGDALPGGERPPSGSASIAHLTGSSSRSPAPKPQSASLSIPPVTASRSGSQNRPPQLDVAALAPSRARPMWRRPPVMVAAGVLGSSILLVAIWGRPPRSQVGAPPPVEQARSRQPANGRIRVTVESDPSGAQVFIDGRPRPVLESTPGSFELAWDEKRDTQVVVRKAGYKEYRTAVRPSADQPIFAGLKPLSLPGTEDPLVTVAPAPAAPPPPPVPAKSPPRHRKHRLRRSGLIEVF